MNTNRKSRFSPQIGKYDFGIPEEMLKKPVSPSCYKKVWLKFSKISLNCWKCIKDRVVTKFHLSIKNFSILMFIGGCLIFSSVALNDPFNPYTHYISCGNSEKIESMALKYGLHLPENVLDDDCLLVPYGMPIILVGALSSGFIEVVTLLFVFALVMIKPILIFWAFCLR